MLIKDCSVCINFPNFLSCNYRKEFGWPGIQRNTSLNQARLKTWSLRSFDVRACTVGKIT